MNQECIVDLIVLAKKASAGPWEYVGKEYTDEGGVYYTVSSMDEEILGEYGPNENDAKYIAAANPATILYIIEKLETALADKGNNRGMADCMQMVRDDLAEVGLISNKTAPMFIVDEILANVSYLSMVESTLMKFIDRMNDHCKEDPAEKILDEFCAKISPIFEQNLKRKRK